MASALQKKSQLYFADVIKSANIALRNGNLQDAEKYLLQALDINSNSTDVMNKLGIIKFKTKEYKQAKEYFKSVLNLEPFHYDANYNYARVLAILGNIENARDYAEKSINLNPDKKRSIDFLKSLVAENNLDSMLDHYRTPAKQFNILFVQESPCIRNYKIATALIQRGHKVSLAYAKAKLSQMYKDLSDSVYTQIFHIKSNKELWELIEHFDLVHCHNEPDILTVTALAGKRPVIHDTHDLISLRDPENETLKYFESIANYGAHGRVYTTPYQLQSASKQYGIKEHSIVLFNYSSQQDLPTSNLPKLSTQDGHIHLVYEGGIGSNPHRNFYELFTQLALNKKIHIHLYPSFKNNEIDKLFANYNNIHIYDPVSPKQIIKEMSQYDIGIIPFNLEKGNKVFLETTIANKLFEYLAAGLPVLTSNLKSYQDFFTTNKVGRTFNSVTEIFDILNNGFLDEYKFDPQEYIYTYEDQIYRLESLYDKVMTEFYSAKIRNNNNMSEKFADKLQDVLIKNDDQFNTISEGNYKIEIPIDVLTSRTLVQSNLVINLSKIIINHFKWIKLNGFAGYDISDVDSIVNEMERKGQVLSKEQKHHIENKNINPLTSRNELGITKVVFPDSFGMFLTSFCKLPRDIENVNIDSRLEYLSEILVKQSIKTQSGIGWAYPYDRFLHQDVHAAVPDMHTTYWVTKGFLNLYYYFSDDKYLQICNDAAVFIEKTLSKTDLGENKICFGLTQFDDGKLHSSNLFCADLLIQLGQINKNENWISLGKKALYASTSDISTNGLLEKYINGYEDKVKNQIATLTDHLYHLNALLNCSAFLNDVDISYEYQHYFNAFINKYFNQFEFPFENNSEKPMIDTFSMGLFLKLLGNMASQGTDVIPIVYKTLPVVFDLFTNESGSFISELDFNDNTISINTFPSFIRYQASLLNGLVQILDAVINNNIRIS